MLEKFNRLSISLLCSKSEHSQKYKDLLSKFNVRVVDIESEEHCQVILESIYCNGILIDIPTYIKSSSSLKEFISNISKIYPTAIIRYDTKIHDIELIISGELEKVSLQEFLECRCHPFEARKLRKATRVAKNLNICMSYALDGKQAKIHGVSLNISENGLFFICEPPALPLGTKVKIQVIELGKTPSIHGTIVRLVKWGEKPFCPHGFGIRIDDIDKEIFQSYLDMVKK